MSREEIAGVRAKSKDEKGTHRVHVTQEHQFDEKSARGCRALFVEGVGEALVERKEELRVEEVLGGVFLEVQVQLRAEDCKSPFDCRYSTRRSSQYTLSQIV